MSSAVTPPPRKRPRVVSASPPPRRSARPSRSMRSSATGSSASATSASGTGSSSLRPSISRSRLTTSGSSGSSSLRRPLPARERRHVGRKHGPVPPAQAADGRHRPDPEAEVVPAEPVAEVVARLPSGPAEVGRLVPAVAGRDQLVDDELEVALHRLGLARELVPVRVGEARAGLRFELVARQVLRAERDRLCEISLEVGGALAGNPVQEIERDVVKSGITQMVERAADGLRAGPSLEHLEQVRLEALGAEGDARHAPVAAGARRARASRSRGSPQRSPPRRAAGPPAGGPAHAAPCTSAFLRRGRRSRAVGQQVALEVELAEQRVDVRLVAVPAPDERDEVAVPAAVGAEGHVHVEVADAAHLRSPSRLRTARKASCGTSTAPTCFMRFLPFFWRSRSLRLRVMSPP